MRKDKNNPVIAIVMVLLLSLPILPVLAGNTLTVTGEVVPATFPSADFSAIPISGKVPLTVQFTDFSTGTITGWAWDFQNDGIVDSTDQNPAFTYTNAGTYSVRLTVTGPAGVDSQVKTDYVTVNALVRKPVARFALDRHAGRAPLTVQFTDRSLFNPTEYLWWFGDGAISTERNPEYTYTRQGIYQVRLRVSNASGSDIAWKIVVVLRDTGR